MIKAYAAMAPGAELEPWEYDPGVLQANEVEIAVEGVTVDNQFFKVSKIIEVQ